LWWEKLKTSCRREVSNARQPLGDATKKDFVAGDKFQTLGDPDGGGTKLNLD